MKKERHWLSILNVFIRLTHKDITEYDSHNKKLNAYVQMSIMQTKKNLTFFIMNSEESDPWHCPSE